MNKIILSAALYFILLHSFASWAFTPPSSSDFSVSLNEDASYTFAASDFNFTDDDNDSFSGIKITSLPDHGTLSYNGSTIGAPFDIDSINIKLLIYEPTENEYGDDYSSFEYQIFDGSEYSSTAYTVTIDVTAINDSPLLDDVSDQNTTEDNGQQVLTLTGISAGPNETDNLLITASSSDTDIIPDPQIDYTSGESTGNLTYTSNANRFGSVTITVTVNDQQISNHTIQKDFTITISNVNDAPSFSPVSTPINVLEDAGLQTIDVTDISPGPYESGSVTLQIVSDNETIIPTPQINQSGTTATIEYTPAANQNGIVNLTLTADDGNVSDNIYSQVIQINVQEANDPPTIAEIPDPSAIEEDTPADSVSISGITGGEEDQEVIVSANSDNTDLITNINVRYSYPDNDGIIVYDIAPDAFGTATITVTVDDQQSEQNTTSTSFLVTVSPIADTPTVTDASTNEGEQTSDGLIITKNDADEDEVSFFKITNITNGTLYQNDGVTEIQDNNFITAIQGSAGLKFTPTNGSSNGGFDIQASTSNTDSGLGGDAIRATINVNATPMSIGIPDQSFKEDTTSFGLSMDSFFDDEEDSDVDLSYTLINISNSDLFKSANFTDRTLEIIPGKDKNGSSDITIRCTDTNGAWVEDEFVITINAVNDPPGFTIDKNVLTLEENFGTTETVTPTLEDSPSDEASQTISFSLNPRAESVDFVDIEINENSGVVTLNAIPNQSGSQSFYIIATDNGSPEAKDSVQFTLNIGAVNNSPAFTVSGDVTANEDFSETLEVTVIPETIPDDETNQEVTYTISPATVSFADISIDTNTGTVSINSIQDQSGTANITITADDGQAENNTYSEDFTITINAINDAPTIDEIVSPIVILEGSGSQEVQISGITAGGNENQQISLFAFSGNTSVIPNPTIDYESPSSTATLTYIPEDNAIGTATITVQVIDNGPSAGENENNTFITFDVHIDNFNDAPSFELSRETVNINEDAAEQTINITGINAGPNETQDLTFSLNNSNSDLFEYFTINYTSPSSTGNIKFKPTANASGSASISITLKDDGPNDSPNRNSYTETISVTVNAINDKPVFTSIPDTLAWVNKVYNYQITTYDVDDNDSQTILANTIPGFLTFKDNGDGTASLSGTPETDDAGDHLVEIRVLDQSGVSSKQQFNIEVKESNEAPEISMSPITIAVENIAYESTISISDNDEVDSAFMLVNGLPDGLSYEIIDRYNAAINGAPSTGTSGTYSVDIKIWDLAKDTASTSYVLQVLSSSSAPSISDFSITTKEDSTYNFEAGTFESNYSDNEFQALSTIQITSIPSNGTLYHNGNVITVNSEITYDDIDLLNYTPDANYSGVDYFDWKASDGTLYSNSSARVTINIDEINDAPILYDSDDDHIIFGFDSREYTLFEGISIEDIDDSRLESATLTFENGYKRNQDVLSLKSSSGFVVVFNDTTGVLTIQGIASIATYENILAGITYQNQTPNEPSFVNRELILTVNDGDSISNELTKVVQFEDVFVDLDIPNGFTPNNDNVNDTWNILNIENYEDVEVRVFERNGNEVYYSKGYEEEWDGSYNGEIVPTGMYFYIIDIKKLNKIYKGTLSVMK